MKIVKGAVDFALSLGFPPHPDYPHASMLLAGIDPSTCTEEFTFGRDGHPLYIQGPGESPAEAVAIMQRVREAGGNFLIDMPGAPLSGLSVITDGFDESDSFGEADFNDDDDDDDDGEPELALTHSP